MFSWEIVLVKDENFFKANMHFGARELSSQSLVALQFEGVDTFSEETVDTRSNA